MSSQTKNQPVQQNVEFTDPLLGFLGTRKGQMMPTMPQKTLNTMIGMAEAPMINDDFGSEVNNGDDEDGCCHLLKLGPCRRLGISLKNSGPF